MNGPSARALREGGIGGSIPYKIGVTCIVKLESGGPLPPEWRKKTVLQGPFGDYGQVLRIDCQEAQGVAFIEYEDKRDAEDAERELHGKSIGGKQINVTLARAPDQKRGLAGFGRTVDIEERIAELARRHRLDEAATARLASVFHDRARLGCDLNRDFEELSEHLAASNKPSALVSMRLADLRAGRTIGPCKYSGGRRGTGMCESDEPYQHHPPRNGAHEIRSSGDGHGRDEAHRERRPRSRERERERGDRDRAQSGRPEERGAPKRSREEPSPKKSRDTARSPEKSRKQGRGDAPGSDGRHRERSRERKPSPKRASSDEAGKKASGRKEHDRGARSRSRQKEKKPRQTDSALPKERAQSSGSSGSRLRKKKSKGGGKDKRDLKEEQKKDSKKKQKRKSESSSSESAGKADQKRPASGKRKKAKSASPGRRRRKKPGSSSSNDSG